MTLAARARAAGRRTAVISNSLGQGECDSYAGNGLEHHFDELILSHQVGPAKPDPAIYELALVRLGVPRSACVRVGDSPANLLPARRLGITTIHYDGTPTALERMLGLWRATTS